MATKPPLPFAPSHTREGEGRDGLSNICPTPRSVHFRLEITHTHPARRPCPGSCRSAPAGGQRPGFRAAAPAPGSGRQGPGSRRGTGPGGGSGGPGPCGARRPRSPSLLLLLPWAPALRSIQGSPRDPGGRFNTAAQTHTHKKIFLETSTPNNLQIMSPGLPAPDPSLPGPLLRRSIPRSIRGCARPGRGCSYPKPHPSAPPPLRASPRGPSHLS